MACQNRRGSGAKAFREKRKITIISSYTLFAQAEARSIQSKPMEREEINPEVDKRQGEQGNCRVTSRVHCKYYPFVN